ncbi:TadE/TadG family type IV pilus assembly protein [Pseudophaeobacter arcticus]|uniref:TadE/TadG family type IV pilus assembly protein n=1 Tax=Pseudophaeobacter arcticus TaxID=385492 RepID=UPI0004178497|nr:TadE family protein [Pseudophaeobacter arcticus]
MIFSSAQRLLRRFRSDTDATVTVEFAILMPLFFMFLTSTVELGMVVLRQSQLERALDIVVRDIRLHTGSAPQHDTVRDQICKTSGFIDNCSTSLRLEMVQLDPFAWTGVNEQPDCISKPEEMLPVRGFSNTGASNDLMLIRACMRFKPLFSGWGFGESLSTADPEGLVSLVAVSAFVQEPR